MANIASMLKDEISRISRKESRRLVDPLKKQVTGQRRAIAELKRRNVELERELAAMAKNGKRPAAAAEQDESGERLPRFSAPGLKALRARLGLSANDVGRLIGVSAQSVYNWEQGKARPRRAQLVQLASLRGIGKREVAKRLAGDTEE
jgi:DNA-binding transcriptional regulator YiaG